MTSNSQDDLAKEELIAKYIKKLIKNVESLQLPHKQLQAFKSLVLMTKVRDDKLIGNLITLGGLPVILRCAKQKNDFEMQIEAICALTNMITGCKDHLDGVMKAGAFPVLCHLLNSYCLQVCEQSVNAIANVVVSGKIYCEQAIDKGIVRSLSYMYYLHPSSPIIIRRVACILRYICRVKLCYTLVKKIIPVIRALIYQVDKDIKLDILYAIVYLTDNIDFPFKLILEYGVLKHMISFLDDSDIKILTTALHGIGNCLKDTKKLVESALDNNILQHLNILVIHNESLVRKSALFCLGELLGNPISYVQDDISAQLIVNIYINLTDEDFDVNKETIYALMNLSATGSKDHIFTLANMEFISTICDMLVYSDWEIIKMILKLILNLIARSEEYFITITSLVRNHIDFTMLEYLMQHENTDIQKFAMEIYTDLNYESYIV
ncbi:importin subunit alpha-3-like [Teleopsis dalmanni]|uniref:importin subunit alpha-3-like n=1 Tax=Teleopsis dalmanni TaxID=139649 RepID=UPI0018CCA9B2|nr:importin subunit alpha-3-like [Teleopsis dalmanni]XP_037943726.1 importin subunit alpha-3-like [Teleopsis dalmanni]